MPRCLTTLLHELSHVLFEERHVQSMPCAISSCPTPSPRSPFSYLSGRGFREAPSLPVSPRHPQSHGTWPQHGHKIGAKRLSALSDGRRPTARRRYTLRGRLRRAYCLGTMVARPSDRARRATTTTRVGTSAFVSAPGGAWGLPPRRRAGAGHPRRADLVPLNKHRYDVQLCVTMGFDRTPLASPPLMRVQRVAEPTSARRM